MDTENLTENHVGESSLSKEDRDTIGEMTNISMGAAVTTLSMFLGVDTDMTTPEVTEYSNLLSLPEPFEGEDKQFVFIQYTQGFAAASGLVIKTADARYIAKSMMGEITAENALEPLSADLLTQMELNNVSEAMHEMLNAASTSMAQVIHRTVEIDKPQVETFDADTFHKFLPKLLTEAFTAVSFDIKLSNGRVIPMIQYIVASEAKGQVEQLLTVEPASAQANAATTSNTSRSNASGQSTQTQGDLDVDAALAALGNQINQDAGASQQAAYQQPQPSAAVQVNPVTVRPVDFSSFDAQQQVFGEENKNLSLVMDVALSLTVELGKTHLSIKEVLELTRGSVIELDRVAGEPVDLYANGKLIAKGEVVVIEDNFGLRITSIVSPADRLRGV